MQCQNDRSQHKNKENAFKQLKSKLYELELQKQKEEQQVLEDSKSVIGWGNQIRSYVLDQSRIKDLRTNVETGNTQNVLDGDIDIFIRESLKIPHPEIQNRRFNLLPLVLLDPLLIHPRFNKTQKELLDHCNDNLECYLTSEKLDHGLL